MKPPCPYLSFHADPTSGIRNIVRNGHFYRTSDSRHIQRFICRDCGRHFSNATLNDCYHQKKRRLNFQIFKLLSSSMTQRRLAKHLNTTRKTIARKLRFLAQQAREALAEMNEDAQSVAVFEFDDVETYEHTKMKPLSITMAVVYPSRRVLGFEVSTMPARGPLAARSREKYGDRLDGRKEARKRLFERISPHVLKAGLIKSDQNPHYTKDVEWYFPHATHQRVKGRKPREHGQGELKKGWDPIFSFNHTAAMLRANMSRLVRQTWNTTKAVHGLSDHLAVYAHFHNKFLIGKKPL